jgi:hypothetical protein
MARRKRSVTDTLFRAARLSADLRAVRKGPAAVGRRIIRKQVYRTTGGIIGSLLRAVLGK